MPKQRNDGRSVVSGVDDEHAREKAPQMIDGIEATAAARPARPTTQTAMPETGAPGAAAGFDTAYGEALSSVDTGGCRCGVSAADDVLRSADEAIRTTPAMDRDDLLSSIGRSPSSATAPEPASTSSSGAPCGSCGLPFSLESLVDPVPSAAAMPALQMTMPLGVFSGGAQRRPIWE